MKYKDFMAQAAIQFMAKRLESLKDEDITEHNEEYHIMEPTNAVCRIAEEVVMVADVLASQLELTFDEQKPGTLNRKMANNEDFFESYDVE